MSGYLAAFFWGLTVLVGLAGWGRSFRLLLLHEASQSWGHWAPTGIALAVAVGGGLNLLGWISPVVVVVFVLAGFIQILPVISGAVTSIRSRRRPRSVEAEAQWRSRKQEAARFSKWRIAAAVAIGILLLVRYAGIVSVPGEPLPGLARGFNLHDDFHAYLVFPSKMLQAGDLGPDPFSERRLMSSLGGQSFLHALLLAVLSHGNLYLLDPGLGLLAVVALTFWSLRMRKAPGWLCALVVAVVVLVPPPSANITSLMIPVALFMSLVWTVAAADAKSVPCGRALVVGVLSAAILSLKTSLIPLLAVVLIVGYGLRILAARVRRATLSEAVIASLVCALCSIPWMISLYRSSGTLLYPFLGVGYHSTTYGGTHAPFEAPSAWSVLWAAGVFYSSTIFISVVLLAVTCGLFGRNWKDRRRIAGRSLLAGTAVSGVVMAYALGGGDLRRFLFPCVFAAAVVLLAETGLRTIPTIRGRRVLGKAGGRQLALGALAAGLLVGGGWDETRQLFYIRLQNAGYGLRGGVLATDEERWTYRTLQGAVPEGAAVLARIDRPFLLDFQRNPVFIIDWPGGASPPPGLPLHEGDRVADFLLAQGIRYVMYSYANEAGFSRAAVERRLAPDGHPWIRSLTENTLLFQDHLMALAGRRRVVWDDGHHFVLDLAAAAHDDSVCQDQGGTCHERSPKNDRSTGVRSAKFCN